MRILLQISPVDKILDDFVLRNKYTIQGMWYSVFLKTNSFRDLHSKKGFKFFCFSDVFRRDGMYNVLFSSPNKKLISEVYDVLKELNYVYIGNYLFEIVKTKKFDIKVRKPVIFETGSPVVVQIDRNKYFNFKKDNNIDLFFRRIEENAMKKYSVFYEKEATTEGKIFDVARFSKSVALPLLKRGKRFLIVGSMWKELIKYKPKNKRFYKFLLDVGLGEKNSLGFGFLNQKVHKK